jgi:uncharacterized membrane protein YphA (DoxX/SURF4 family)
LKNKPIYVETQLDCSMEALWEATQDPQLHKEWDLRFTDIAYLPRENEEEPQRFLYTTQIGFGLKIAGEGKSVAQRNLPGGERVSSLHFSSDQALSLIREGSGYWRYIPRDRSVTFLTWYNYEPRFGWLGQLFDRFVFRPLMGWATAWSFDCLRIWLERGIHPRRTLKKSIAYLTGVWILALIWIYHGLVPKLLFPESGELALLQELGVFAGRERVWLALAGMGEIALGLSLLWMPRIRLLQWCSIAFLIGLGLTAILTQPEVLIQPFDPFTLNLAMIGLSVLCLTLHPEVAFAGRCKRKMTKMDRKES